MLNVAMPQEILPIESTVELDCNYQTVSERYFTDLYFVPRNPHKKTMLKPRNTSEDKQKMESPFPDQPSGLDTRVLRHSNRICVVTLSPRHPVIRLSKSITKVDFNVDGTNRLLNKVSGKSKRGAQVVGPFSPLCRIHCSDDSSYTVLAGIRGKLSEVNERLVERPSLITEASSSEGYIGVVIPPMSCSESAADHLFSRAEYDDLYEQARSSDLSAGHQEVSSESPTETNGDE